MEEFTGQETIQARRSLTMERLGDPSWLASSIPDATIVATSDDFARWIATPSIPFLTGEIVSTLIIVPSDNPDEIIHAIDVDSRGTGCDVEAVYHIQGDDTASIVDWRIEITKKTGLLKLVPSMMIQKFVQDGITKAWDAIRIKLEAE